MFEGLNISEHQNSEHQILSIQLQTLVLNEEINSYYYNMGPRNFEAVKST